MGTIKLNPMFEKARVVLDLTTYLIEQEESTATITVSMDDDDIGPVYRLDSNIQGRCVQIVAERSLSGDMITVMYGTPHEETKELGFEQVVYSGHRLAAEHISNWLIGRKRVHVHMN